MSDRPTPETDNQIFEAWDDEGHYIAWVVDADFARRLERQRDDWYGAFLLATKRAGDAGELLVELKRQRDESLKALEMVEIYLVERGIETRGTIGRTLVLPRIRAAIAAVKGGHDE